MTTYEEKFQMDWQKALDHKDEPWVLNDEELKILCSEFYLDESYMREYKNYLLWGIMCQHQIMSETFIREMDEKGYIKWWNIAMSDKIPFNEKLIEKHLEDMCKFNLVHWDIPIIDLFINRKVSKEFFFRNYHLIDWERAYKTMSMRTDMIISNYRNWLIELGIDAKYGR